MFKYRQYGMQSSNINSLSCNTLQCNLQNGYANNYLNNYVKPLPLSKTTNLTTSTNDSSGSCRIKYAQFIKTFGTTESSTSYPRKTCSIGGPTFSY